jgi:uncharacterized protein (DUF885 family)
MDLAWCVYVPIPDIKEYNMYGDEDLFFTEAIPGHHFQISLNRKTNLYLISENTMVGAYGEGWAYTQKV